MSSVSLDIDIEIGILVGRYGYASVLKSLEENMRKTYEYLREYYGAGAGAGAGNQTNSVDISGNQTNSVGVSAQVSAQVSANSGNQKKTRNRKIKGVAVEPPGALLKTEKVENSSGDQKPQPPPGSPETPIQHVTSSIQEKLVEPALLEIPVNSSGDQKKVKVSGVGVGGGKGSGVKVSVVHVTDHIVEEVPQSEENVMVSGEETGIDNSSVNENKVEGEKKGEIVYVYQRTPKEQKIWQENEEKKKHEELVRLGIRRETILTEENLRKWLVDEKRSCAWIAREKAGCPASFISELAESFNIESEVRRKRREKAEKNDSVSIKNKIHNGIFIRNSLRKKQNVS